MIDFNKKIGDMGPELSQDEMKQNLSTAANSLQDNYRTLNTNKIASSQKIEASKKETLNKLFDMLERYDVDPSDQEQLSLFVEELKKVSPDVYSFFERALRDLIGGGGIDLSREEQVQDPVAPGEEAPISPEEPIAPSPKGGNPIQAPMAGPRGLSNLRQSAKMASSEKEMLG